MFSRIRVKFMNATNCYYQLRFLTNSICNSADRDFTNHRLAGYSESTLAVVLCRYVKAMLLGVLELRADRWGQTDECTGDSWVDPMVRSATGNSPCESHSWGPCY